MANPTKSELLSAISDGFDVATTNNSTPLSDSDFTGCLNSMLDTAKGVDPVKGTPTVKY